MKKIHFISGLPRSGSTLLTSILNQNPRFYSDISSPLARFVRAIITESFAAPGYKLQCPTEKRIKLVQSLIDTYYYDKDNPVCFNTNRGWTLLLDILNVTNPDSKVICCVRDINWILDSFEILFRKNPFTVSKLYSENESENVYTRCQALMTPGHTLRFAYDGIKEAITGDHKNKLMLIEYEYLAKYPDQILKSLYNFIDEPYFEHDFNNVISEYDEYDEDANIIGLHKIRKEIKFIERPTILPPDIWQTFSNLEVWR
jgi:sulfotransferase